MLKVFIVEDKFEILDNLIKSIDWEASGYELCGEASDGELAFPLIQKLKPDIVITDTAMPYMDGMSLCRLIKKEMPWIEIIILSDDESFEYAREGIRLGIARYLLKPISGQELLTELDAIGQQIRKNQREREIIEEYRTDRRQFFRHLVTGAVSAAELLEAAREQGMELSAMWYNIVLITTQSLYGAGGEHSGAGLKTKELLEHWSEVNKGHLLVFDRDLEGQVLLFQADSREELEYLQNDCLKLLKEYFTGEGQAYYFGGIGSPVNRLGGLPQSFEKAGQAFAHRFFSGDRLILDSEKLSAGTYTNRERIDIGNISPKQIDRGKLREFLKVGSLEESKAFVDGFFQSFGGSDVMKSDIFRQYIILDAYFSVVDFLEDLQIERDEIVLPDVTSDILQSVEGAEVYLNELVEKALALREKAAGNRYGDILDEVMRYIDENYADEELSLNLLASHVNFSPNHLSAIFSQHTGQTFIKYLTDIRMNKAKELLRCTGKKSSVISAEVGYKDPHYFSFLFKKTQGMTPTQFRRGKSAEGN